MSETSLANLQRILNFYLLRNLASNELFLYQRKKVGSFVSYSSNVKQEITKKIPATNLECLAEISSIFENKSILTKDGIEIKMENSILAKRVYSLIKVTSSLKFGIKYSITKKFTEHKVYTITLYQQKGLKEFLDSFKFSYLDIIQNDEIFRGYIRGFFLSCGYIKDPKK